MIHGRIPFGDAPYPVLPSLKSFTCDDRSSDNDVAGNQLANMIIPWMSSLTHISIKTHHIPVQLMAAILNESSRLKSLELIPGKPFLGQPGIDYIINPLIICIISEPNNTMYE